MLNSRHSHSILAGLTLATALSLIAGAHSASAQSFTMGDLVVSRVGDGTAALSNSGTAVFLDEFTKTGTPQTNFTSINLTTTGTNPFVTSGTATSEGALTLSGDGKFLTISGYDAKAGAVASATDTKLANSTAASVPREVAVINAAGAVNTATTLGGDFSGNNPRGVASADGSTLIVGGATGGLFSTTTGTTDGGTGAETTVLNIRNVNLFGGNTYFSTLSSITTNGNKISYQGIYQVNSDKTATLIASDATTGGAYDFYFADANTLYVADNTSTNGILNSRKP